MENHNAPATFITYSPIIEEEFPFVAELYNYYIKNSTAVYLDTPIVENEVANHFSLNSPKTQGFIIKFKKRLAGFCFLREYNKKEGFRYTREVSIYLDSQFCRLGIGRNTLNYLETKAKDQGVHVLVAGICSENLESINLFEKNGFMLCGQFIGVGYKFNRYLDTCYFQKILP